MVGKSYRLLRDDDRTFNRHLISRYRKGAKPLTATERVRLGRKRSEISKAIADLTHFANEWPEEQLRQVFTREKLAPFLKALLFPATAIHPARKRSTRRVKGKGAGIQQEKRRERLIEICRGMIQLMNESAFLLAPEAYYVLSRSHDSYGPTMSIKALLVGH